MKIKEKKKKNSPDFLEQILYVRMRNVAVLTRHKILHTTYF